MQSYHNILNCFIWALLTFITLINQVKAETCSGYGYNPTVRQTQVGSGNPLQYTVEVRNNCPMCPVINIHLKCGNFSQALVKPEIFKVLSYNDCVVNGGLPLGPLQKFAFTYSYHHEYSLSPLNWNFQCE